MICRRLSERFAFIDLSMHSMAETSQAVSLIRLGHHVRELDMRSEFGTFSRLFLSVRSLLIPLWVARRSSPECARRSDTHLRSLTPQPG
jgi:hypothetical protein